MAEVEGFEPPVLFRHARFQGECIRPLCHTSPSSPTTRQGAWYHVEHAWTTPLIAVDPARPHPARLPAAAIAATVEA